YSVSHDLRGPLRAIDGFSHAVLTSSGDRLDPDERRHLARIREATNRMGQLIDDLLALARITRREMRRDDVNLSSIARSVCEPLRAGAAQRRVELAIAREVRAHGDAPLLVVLLENLLGNAWKFTSRQPRARIEFGAQASEKGPTVYHVRDNGAGFDMT